MAIKSKEGTMLLLKQQILIHLCVGSGFFFLHTLNKHIPNHRIFYYTILKRICFEKFAQTPSMGIGGNARANFAP